MVYRDKNIINKFKVALQCLVVVVMTSVVSNLLLSSMAQAADQDTIGINPQGLTINLVNQSSVAAGRQILSVYSSSGTGYYVSMSVDGDDNRLINGGWSIEALANATQDSPSQLRPGTWGYAIPGRGGFDVSYVTDSAASSLWASVPTVNAGSVTVAESGSQPLPSVANYEIWFGVRAPEQQLLAGSYQANIVYTVTANEMLPPEPGVMTPTTYNLGDETVPATVTIAGQNLAMVNKVCVDLSGNHQCDDGEWAELVEEPTHDKIVANLPNSLDITPNDDGYDVYVENSDGEKEAVPQKFIYTKEPRLTDASPKFYNLDGDVPMMMTGGVTHQIILTQSGQVFISGTDNDHGQLGTGDGLVYTTPHNITSLFDGRVVDVSTLNLHSLALTDTGHVYAWGGNNYGQIGDGTTSDAMVPVDITSQFGLPAGKKIVDVFAAYESSFAIDSDGQLYAWGRNNSGQLGLGDTTDQSEPTKLTYSFNGKIVNLATDSHTLVVTDTGHVYAWGLNDHGQIGNDTVSDKSEPVATPVDVTEGLGGANIVGVYASSNGSFALTDAGQLYAWGQNDYGNLGFGERIKHGLLLPDLDDFLIPDYVEGIEPTAPRLVSFFEDDPIEQFTAGYHQSLAITKSGKLYIWGGNDDDRLGVGSGDSYYYLSPRPRPGASGHRVNRVAKRAPVELTALSGKLTSVASSGNQIFAIDNQGHTYVWGSGGIAGPQDVTDYISYSLITISGVNLDGTTSVFVDFNDNGQLDSGEECDNLSVNSSTRLTCDMPGAGNELVKLGAYHIGAIVNGRTVISEFEYRYQ